MARRWPWLLLALLGLVLAATLGLRQLVDADRLARWLDGWLQQNAGLKLEIGGDTSIRLRPRPSVMLQEVRLSRLDDGATLFTARRFELELRYRTLWSEGIELHRLRLVGPEFALDRLLELGGGADDRPPGLPPLPRLRRGILVEDGLLLSLDSTGAPNLRIESLQLATGPLLDQEAFDIELSGVVHEPFEQPLPLLLQLDGVSTRSPRDVRLDPIRFRLWQGRRAQGDPQGQLAGTLAYGLDEGLDANLGLDLGAALLHVLGLPERPLQARLSGHLRPDGPARLSLSLDHGGQQLELQADALQPARLAATLAELDPERPLDLLARLATLPPPLRVQASVDAAAGEGWQISGLRVGLAREMQVGPPAPGEDP